MNFSDYGTVRNFSEMKDTELTERNEKTGAVLVVGGGIAGMQASLDLADSGFKVYLAEKSPFIGGKMTQLDKTFPTNDCATCILTPRMVDVAENKNIELLVYSEMEEIKGYVGNFDVKIRRKATYVDWSKCTGCEECVGKCPARIYDEFNEGLSRTKAIGLPFPQAVPKKVTIKREFCHFFLKGKCRVCEKVCQLGAINFDDQDQIIERKVGAIILAPGYEVYDAHHSPEFGFGRYPNVVTSLQFERLLSAAGPTGGHVQRPSDSQKPKRIAFLQCVGSRDQNHDYCSSVCCMYATKEAILAREHEPDVDVDIYIMDMRA
ncbi:FAD-dependent oxidoreductase, partial [Candidatus Hakubella thermalkaliphila]